MKVSKELNDALQAISKEVDGWPQWKRSIEPGDHQQFAFLKDATSPIDKSSGDVKPRLSARAANV